MPKITRIIDGEGGVLPLRITHRKSHNLSECKTESPSIRVKCGCCPEAVVIFFDNDPTGDIHIDSLEIGGVSATIDQWRQVFLPLLQIALPG